MESNYQPWSFMSKEETAKTFEKWGRLARGGGLLTMIGGLLCLFSLFSGFVGILFIVGTVMAFFGITLALVPSIQKKAFDKEELRLTQLEAIKRGNVNTEFKGKIRKLK